MATVFAKQAYDMTKYDFFDFASKSDLVPHVNEPFTVRGHTYQDQIEADRTDGSGSIFLAFDTVQSGRITGFFHSSSSSAADVWAGIENISFDFQRMGNAWDSPAKTDDQAVLAAILSKADTFNLSGKADAAKGYGGNDRMNGNGGADRLWGGGGADTVQGGAGSDRLWGEAGQDTLVAGRGQDMLNGGAGKDRLVGGTDAGADTFVYTDWLDSMFGARDEIVNFTRGVDHINLRGVDADENSDGSHERFHWSGRTSDAHAVWWKPAQGGVLVMADVSGDGLAEMEIFVKGLGALGSGDLLL